MQTQQQNYSSPIRPQVKAADLMFQNTFASMMTVTIEVTSTLQPMK